MTISQQIAQELHIAPAQVEATIDLLDAGNTLPFIARYRKEVTGELDEEQLRQINHLLDKQRALDKRRQTIVDAITEQEQMTPQLAKALAQATTLTALEDLYQPYKAKRKTRAGVARTRGLEPLAQLILKQERTTQSLDQLARSFLNKEVKTTEEAWAGARDIVAEMVSDDAGIRQTVREKALKFATLTSTKIDKAEDERQVYALYYEATFRVNRLRPHQILALNRGEADKVLRLKFDLEERDWLMPMHRVFRPNQRSPLVEQLHEAMVDGGKRLLLPAIERDVRRTLTETAENHAITTFATNLRQLLTQPPLVGHTVLGLDPGYRTGCKVAVVDETGKVLATSTIYPHAPQRKWQPSKDTLSKLIQRHQVTLIAIGNGTASRETEQLAAELIQESHPQLHYLMVNEAGASVYSASSLARAELPDLDVTLRGAVSIARRVQDPLAEQVKIDPRSIGVGLYQHDLNQKALSTALTEVVESVVNQVGVDVNTASPALLSYIAGIGPKLSESIVAYRDTHGSFPNRQALLHVSGLGAKAFEQAAGFLRIREGNNPLDTSAIHPESYPLTKKVLAKIGISAKLSPDERAPHLQKWRTKQAVKQLAQELNAGIPTLTDILEQLIRPGRDPREDLPTPILRRDVLSMDDLKVGMMLQGTVRNVVDFGVFIDIGVKQDGLLHRSQYPSGQQFAVGDIVDVTLLGIDSQRNRISLGWNEA